jgi:hypothetical protein
MWSICIECEGGSVAGRGGGLGGGGCLICGTLRPESQGL